MSRSFRKFRAAAMAVSALMSSGVLAKPVGPSTQKPTNIIFVLVDDLRFDAMGFLTPGLKTPNIDFLAKNGVYFPNAVVTSSLCSPSRATILTGCRKPLVFAAATIEPSALPRLLLPHPYPSF
jgi:arylsulfatase A-like enzyme